MKHSGKRTTDDVFALERREQIARLAQGEGPGGGRGRGARGGSGSADSDGIDTGSRVTGGASGRVRRQTATQATMMVAIHGSVRGFPTLGALGEVEISKAPSNARRKSPMSRRRFLGSLFKQRVR